MEQNTLNTIFSSGKDDWETPDDLFKRLDERYRFVLDAAANGLNHKCARWFGPDSDRPDALDIPWPLDEGNIWLNPPYSRGLQAKFVEKAVAEVHRIWNKPGWYVEAQRKVPGQVVCLLPARTDTRLFHDVVLEKCSYYEFLRGRVKFKGALHGAPFPSMIVVF